MDGNRVAPPSSLSSNLSVERRPILAAIARGRGRRLPKLERGQPLFMVNLGNKLVNPSCRPVGGLAVRGEQGLWPVRADTARGAMLLDEPRRMRRQLVFRPAISQSAGRTWIFLSMRRVSGENPLCRHPQRHSSQRTQHVIIAAHLATSPGKERTNGRQAGDSPAHLHDPPTAECRSI
jgi:hypothetical protein